MRQKQIAKFTVDPTNDEPTNITFVPGSVNENSAAGTVITTLDTTDLETSSGGTDTHTYVLTSGYGDNEKVEIDGDKVKLVDGVNRSQATSEKTANNAGQAEEQLVTINGDTPSAGDSYVITVGGAIKATLEITDANKASYGDVASVRTELVSQLNTNLTGITAPKTGVGAFDTDITLTADSAGTVIGSVVSSGADQHNVVAANTTNTTAASTDQVRLKIGDQTPHEGDGYSISVGGSVEASLTITSGNISSYGDVASVRDELISQLNGNLTGITASPDSNASGFPMDIILTAASGTSIGAVVSNSIFSASVPTGPQEAPNNIITLPSNVMEGDTFALGTVGKTQFPDVNSVTYTVQAGDTVEDVRANLIADMNAAYSAASTGLTAQNGTNANEIDMGGSFDGLLLNETLANFTQVMSSTAGSSTTTHGATITLDGNPDGKTYSVTIEHSGNNVEIANYVGGTGDNLAKVQTEIIADINAFASANNADIQASAEGGAGVKIVSTVADQPLE